jgi:hypothetical protein
MWLRFLHSMGLTNLSDEQVEEYIRLRGSISEFSPSNQVLALLVLLVSLGGYVTAVYIAYSSSQEKTKQANVQAADRTLQNTARVDEQLAEIQASLSEINEKQVSSPVKEKITEISQQVGAINKTNNKIKSKAYIDKFSNTQEFQVGAIVKSGKAKIYKPEQKDEFIRDAGKFIDSHPVDSVRSRTVTASYDCSGGPGGCISISSPSDPNSDPGPRVEVLFTNEPIKVAKALEALGDKELAASFASSDEPLCRWLHRLSQPTALAESAPSPLVAGALRKR